MFIPGRAVTLAVSAGLFFGGTIPAMAGLLTSSLHFPASPAAGSEAPLTGLAALPPAAGTPPAIFHAAAGAGLQSTGERSLNLADFQDQYTDSQGFLRSRICLARPLSPDNICSMPSLRSGPPPAPPLSRPRVADRVTLRIHTPEGVARAFESFLRRSHPTLAASPNGRVLLHLDIVSAPAPVPISAVPAIPRGPLSPGLQQLAGTESPGGAVDLTIAGVALLASRRWKSPD